MNIQKAFEKQGFSVGWRGGEPGLSSNITLEYLAEDVDGLPRANMADGDTLDGLNLNQLNLDYDDEINAGQESTDRKSKCDEIEEYALSIIAGFVSEWDTLDDVKLIASIWNMFDVANTTADQTSAKDTYLHAKLKMSQAMTAPIEDVRAYYPATDPDWP